MSAAARVRVRPGDPSWPSQSSWDRLRQEVKGNLIEIRSPFVECAEGPSEAGRAEFFKRLKNPYHIGDEVGLTQTLAWVGAWTSTPSTYAVAARTTGDVVAAVNFAREHNLRLVVKGGGHSYKGTSNAADSLLIWTRAMDAVTLNEGFVASGREGRDAPQPAVTVGAGAMWGKVYGAVTTRAGRYVQGGGCLTVGVAGLVQSGGFGSFSKGYGLAAASLLEAEIVTADGEVRIANARSNPELFWGLKGGGGGSLGIVTRMTLRTHELPAVMGRLNMTIRAQSDEAFRRLIGKVVSFYGEALFNPHWGEQIVCRPEKEVEIRMAFQGIDGAQAESTWRPFLDWLGGAPQDYSFVSPLQIEAVPARSVWDANVRPEAMLFDDRPGAPAENVLWAGNLNEVGMVLYGYQSVWIPASLLQAEKQAALADALFAAARNWDISLHCNKGLAGASPEAVHTARDTAMNPAVLDAFALLICAAGAPPAYPGIAGHELDVPAAARHAQRIEKAMNEMRRVLASPTGAYVAESDYFDPAWQQSYWGTNYQRLRAVKDRYDPEGLFFVHHGVGSEDWSSDGFERVALAPRQ
jgi:FAD/FMN-containing dehydrogenase